MDITIIGNGFDLSHNLKTSFYDFMKYYNSNSMRQNIVYNYLEEMNAVSGWLDFENEVQNFLILLSKFSTSITMDMTDGKFMIEKTNFVTSTQSDAFYKTVAKTNYDFFKIEVFLIKILDNSWIAKLVKIVNEDIDDIKLYLKDYLQKINSEFNTNFEKMSVNATNAIENCDVCLTFNYTSFVENYLVDKKPVYAHGKLDGDIILGIPYTDKITLAGFSHHFKTSQFVNNGFTYSLPLKALEETRLHFIGFSFGKSDHYFFSDILGYLNNPGSFISVFFIFYYHSDESKNQYISNMRDFVGDTLLVKLFKQNRIQFRKYVE